VTKAPNAPKAPAYQWYPKDAETDETYRLMSCEQLGVFERLRDHEWLEGSLPTDIGQLAAIVGHGMSAERLRKIWPGVSPCFKKRGKRLLNRRLERQRAELARYHAGVSEKGKKGAAARWQGHSPGIRRALPTDGSSTAIAIATTTATPEEDVLEDEEGGQPARTSEQQRADERAATPLRAAPADEGIEANGWGFRWKDQAAREADLALMAIPGRFDSTKVARKFGYQLLDAKLRDGSISIDNIDRTSEAIFGALVPMLVTSLRAEGIVISEPQARTALSDCIIARTPRDRAWDRGADLDRRRGRR
jgi:uncharacterized protein YdaU (DUF1376 family)